MNTIMAILMDIYLQTSVQLVPLSPQGIVCARSSGISHYDAHTHGNHFNLRIQTKWDNGFRWVDINLPIVEYWINNGQCRYPPSVLWFVLWSTWKRSRSYLYRCHGLQDWSKGVTLFFPYFSTLQYYTSEGLPKKILEAHVCGVCGGGLDGDEVR